MHADAKHGILVAVDDSAAAEQTLLYVARMIAGILQPDGGRVLIEGSCAPRRM